MGEKAIEYRFERKFFVELLSRDEIEHIVLNHPAMFSEIYEERTINNIYFDTLNLDHFKANVDGAANRHKCRVRWYNEFNKKATLEFKIKKGYLGKKQQFKINFDLTHMVESTIKNTNIDEFYLSELKSYSASVVNKYQRKYYQSVDKKFRFTIDYNVQFCEPSQLLNEDAYINIPFVILELKYDFDHDLLAREMTQYLPFRMTKSSKYVSGLNLITNGSF